MNLSINGQSQVPPGFRFHPTEEELLHYYLRKKLASHKIDLDVISEVDLNKLEPWDIQEKCKIGSTPQNDWYFFSHKDKKYPTGTRTNRATISGFWKATGRDKIIYSGFTRIGLRKTLVFYKGRAPHGLKSDWIMHEYRLDEGSNDPTTIVSSSSGEPCGEDGWVVCRVFKKKNYLKTMESPSTPNASSNVHVDSNLHNHHHPLGSRNDGVLDQILMYMGRSSSNTTCKIENHNESLNTFSDSFMHLPRLDSPTSTTLNNSTSIITSSNFNDQEPISFKTYYDQTTSFGEILVQPDHQPCSYNQLHEDDHNHAQNSSRVNDWVALDRLVASQLNGTSTTDQEENGISKQLSFFGDTSITSFCSSDDQNDNDIQLPCQYICTSSSGDRSRNNQTSSTTTHEVYGTNCDNDLWKYFSSTKPSQSSAPSPDPLCHMSV